jgi:hypothetical protein
LTAQLYRCLVLAAAVDVEWLAVLSIVATTT